MGIFTVMLNLEYINILSEISGWHIVPHFPYPPTLHRGLTRLLGDIPFYADKGGNLVIGACSPETLPGFGLCLRANLPGCGGVLRSGECDKYLFSSVSGYQLPNRLLGRKFGVYSALSGLKICELEVEWVDMASEAPVLYFLPGEKERKEISLSGPAIISHPSAFAVNGSGVSGWNLTSLINSALVIHSLKTKRPGDGLCACLSRQISGQRGVAEGLDKLFLLDFDFFAYKNGKQAFGYSHMADASLEQDPYKLPLLPGAKSLLAYLGLENIANATADGRFEPEVVPSCRLEDYLEFAGTLVETLQSRKMAPVAHAPEFDEIIVVNDAPAIAAAIENSVDFAGFLNSGMLKITDIFKKHGLLFAAAKSSSYGPLRKRLVDKSFDAGADTEKLETWVRECLAGVRKALPAADKRPLSVKVVTILMSPVPVVSTSSGGIMIFLSQDKIDSAQLKKTLFRELAFRLTEKFLADLGLPVRLIEYYSRGLMYALAARLLGISLEESLGFTKQKFECLQVNSSELRRSLQRYLVGELCSLHESRHHKYFKSREFGDPYKSGQEDFSGYGSFLAAAEVFSLLESGKFNEKILSF